MNIGDRMKQLRKEKHISADTIAEKIGVSRSTIFRYEKGDIEKVPINVVAQIASILEIKPEELMGLKPKSIEEDITSVIRKLQDNRKKNVLDFATDQLKEQRKSADLVQDNVKQLPHAEATKTSEVDPFMPIAAHLDHELSDDERAEVDAWERKIAAEDDDDDEDDEN